MYQAHPVSAELAADGWPEMLIAEFLGFAEPDRLGLTPTGKAMLDYLSHVAEVEDDVFEPEAEVAS